MLYRKNLHVRVTTATFFERDGLLSITTPRSLAQGVGITRVSPREIERSGRVEVRAGKQISSYLG